MKKQIKSDYVELLENALDAGFLTRPDGTILYANAAACALFGYTPEEFQALGRNAIIDPSDPELVDGLEQRRRTGRFQGILTMARKDKSHFAAEVSSAIFTDSSGKQRTSTFVRDITERELTQKTLRAANEQLERAFAEVRQLQGILPICAYCKSIRNDDNYWQQVEEYLSAHAPVEFTHGICPKCYEKIERETK
jgi:PAS domain S-box-containing protein